MSGGSGGAMCLGGQWIKGVAVVPDFFVGGQRCLKRSLQIFGDVAALGVRHLKTLSPSSSVGCSAFKREVEVYNSAGEASLPWDKHPQQI